MWCTEDGVQESTIHGRNAMNKYFIMKATPSPHSTTEEYHHNQYLLKQKRKTELRNGASQTRLSWFSGLKNFIILFQFVIIVVLLFIIWCMHADHFVV